MGHNNKHILEKSSESGKSVEGLLSYVDHKIKDDSHENIILMSMSIISIRKG